MICLIYTLKVDCQNYKITVTFNIYDEKNYNCEW